AGTGGAWARWAQPGPSWRSSSSPSRGACASATSAKAARPAASPARRATTPPRRIRPSRTPPYKPHPHELVGKDCKHGYYEADLQERRVHSFPNLGIQCVKKKDVSEAITCRLQTGNNPFSIPEAKVWEEEFDLNSVRLCFQASFTQASGQRLQLAPVVSQPIYDNRECTGRSPPHATTFSRLSVAMATALEPRGSRN
ncbi:unnamed protein product, partial [Tetraodon nigroviridis]